MQYISKVVYLGNPNYLKSDIEQIINSCFEEMRKLYGRVKLISFKIDANNRGIFIFEVMKILNERFEEIEKVNE